MQCLLALVWGRGKGQAVGRREGGALGFLQRSLQERDELGWKDFQFDRQSSEELHQYHARIHDRLLSHVFRSCDLLPLEVTADVLTSTAVDNMVQECTSLGTAEGLNEIKKKMEACKVCLMLGEGLVEGWLV